MTQLNYRLMTSALALMVANVVALPHTLSAIAELSGRAASWNPATTSKGCGCSQPVNRVMSEEEVKRQIQSVFPFVPSEPAIQVQLMGDRDPQSVPPVIVPLPPSTILRGRAAMVAGIQVPTKQINSARTYAVACATPP